MYFTPEEIAALEKHDIYKSYYKDKAWSTHTVATVLAHLDVVGGDAQDLGLIKYLLMILNEKYKEEANQLGPNEEVFAAIVNAGGDPAKNSYPLKTAIATGTIAGAAGNFAAKTGLAAVAGKILFFDEIDMGLLTDTASGGIVVEFNDGTGGGNLTQRTITKDNPSFTFKAFVFCTVATLLEIKGVVGTAAVLDDNDKVYFAFKYREI